jgi:enoyl-[acyl-carrier protein] reductase II
VVEGEVAFEMTKDGNAYVVVGIGTFTGSEVVIPAYYKDLPVVEIAPKAFEWVSGVKSITIPHTVHTIATGAFSWCTSLQNIYVTGSKHFASENGILLSGDYSTLLYYPMAKPEKIVELPDRVVCIAEGAFAGTRFILSKECRAADATKQNLLDTPQDDYVVFTQWGGISKWRSTPNPVVLAAVEANKAGDLDPAQGSYYESELKGNLDAGVNSGSSVTSLIRSIDSCADIVADLARGYE